MDVAAIAKSENVSEKTVRDSIAQVELHRKRNTSYEMDIALRSVIIESVPQVKDTLHGLLTAQELVEQKDSKTGKIKVVKMEDKTTRIEAVRLVTSLAATLMPKVPTFQNNVTATAQAAATTVTASETNEERFRRLQERAKAFNALPPKVAGVPDYIDAGGNADDEDDDDEEDDEDK